MLFVSFVVVIRLLEIIVGVGPVCYAIVDPLTTRRTSNSSCSRVFPLHSIHQQRMFVIGIVGGIASGKSAIASQFQTLGAEVIDADQLGHEVLDDPQVITAAVDRWGPEVLDADGRLCRDAIAHHVFPTTDNLVGDNKELDFWQRWTHPRIEQRMAERLAQLASRIPPPPGVVIDAALLFEAGWDQKCDSVIFLDVPREIRLQRARSRGWSESDIASREAAQMSIDEKRQKADFVIDNSVALEETYRSVRDTWIRLSS
jgi:dephospho-CoA kinase